MTMRTTRRTAAYDTGTLLGFGPKRRHSTMTLALALHGGDFIVLGADKQQTKTYKGGNFVEDVTKLVEIHDSCVFAVAGPAYGEYMFHTCADQLLRSHALSPILSDKLGTRLRNKFKRTYTTKRQQEDAHMAFLLAGVNDEDELSIELFESPHFLPLAEKEFGRVGSTGQSLYFLKHVYMESKPIKPSLNQLTLLACFCITETAKQDRSVGRDMDIWILRKGQPVEELTQTRIEEIRREAEEISGTIAKQFLRR